MIFTHLSSLSNYYPIEILGTIVAIIIIFEFMKPRRKHSDNWDISKLISREGMRKSNYELNKKVDKRSKNKPAAYCANCASGKFCRLSGTSLATAFCVIKKPM